MASVVTSLPRTVTDLIDCIQHEWSALLGVLKAASQEQMCVSGPGGWSVKDVLAHISGWERFLLLCQFKGLSPHEALQVEWEMLESPDFDALNAIMFERNRERPLADVLDDLKKTHSQLLAALEQVADDDLTKKVDAVFMGVPFVAVVRAITYHHYKDHREMIVSLLNK